MEEPDEIDFLSLLEEPSDVQVQLVPTNDDLQLVPFEGNEEMNAIEVVCQDSQSGSSGIKMPTMAGKVGSGRHGTPMERQLLTCHMRYMKSLHNKRALQEDVAELLCDSEIKKDGKLVSVQSKITSCGLVLQLHRKSQKGNRFQRAVGWKAFFQSAYGKLKRTSHLALSLDVSRSMVRFMCTTMSSVYLSQQLLLLARLVSFAQACKPLVCVRQLKWDETQLQCSVDANQSGSKVQSTWQVMAARQRIILGLEGGQCMIFRIVCPPAVLLSSGAHDIYYALRYHPFFAEMNKFCEAIASHCKHRALILESDGAYSNERLVAHLLQKDKLEPIRKFILHMKCQNHQTQLINVALLAAVGKNVLNRLYGMMVFLRNLGYWLRLRQALFEWMLTRVIVKQCFLSFQFKILYLLYCYTVKLYN